MKDKITEDDETQRPLRYGWTTGTCATAAARAAVIALWTKEFPDPVGVILPNGSEPTFVLAHHETGDEWAEAGIVKDAGDDPDVTHGALIKVRVSRGKPGAGVTFQAGAGVGTVTRPGLPIAPGEPAINPVPRQMILAAIEEVARHHSKQSDIVVEISIPNGEKIAEKTLNPRLGIVGGLSILGTTGIVVPFSCSAWIHSIHRGIDVARASGITHVAGSTGSTSEAAIAKHYSLSDVALIDMGDFAGGMLKYLKAHPIPRVTIAGGFAKISKLAEGRMDLHSRRGLVNIDQISDWFMELGAASNLVKSARSANTAQQILDLALDANIDLADEIAKKARVFAAKLLRGSSIGIDVVVFDRNGKLCGQSGIETC